MKGPFDDMFANTPFDLNRDGHIDAGEWSLINSTIFREDDEEDFFMI